MAILGVSVKRAGAYELGATVAPHIKVAGQYLPWDAEVVMIKADGAYDLGNGVLPINTVLPSISGPDSNPGTLLFCAVGTWSGNPTPVITHQWQRDGSDIPGETNLSYTIQEVDRGKAITCQERGTNLVGSIVVSSNAITPPDTAFSNEFTPEFH